MTVHLCLFHLSDKFVSEVLAYLFIIFFIIIPLLLKMKVWLERYERSPLVEVDLERGLCASVSQVTLRVPENGGVE